VGAVAGSTAGAGVAVVAGSIVGAEVAGLTAGAVVAVAGSTEAAAEVGGLIAGRQLSLGRFRQLAFLFETIPARRSAFWIGKNAKAPSLCSGSCCEVTG
jgi:hypothetical protein